ncbi:MAG: glycosyltransferase family 2 protein [Thermodesulfobacteriota bacterium]
MTFQPVEISVVIVNWNSKALLMRCLGALFKTIDGIDFEIFVVDNGSLDGSVEAVRERYPEIRLIVNETNLGFAAANNQALEKITGRYILLLNTDAEVAEGAVYSLFDFMEKHPEAGMACGQLLDCDGGLQNSIANFPTLITLLFNESLLRFFFPKRFPSKLRTYHDPVEVESCIGACMLVRKSAVDAVGVLDETFFFFFEETDWALRMYRTGWKIYFVPNARIIHGQGQSVGKRSDARILYYRSRYAYFRKWYPHGYQVIGMIAFIRLLINTLFTGVGIVLTLGVHKGLRDRLATYIRLVTWHLRGCPDI